MRAKTTVFLLISLVLGLVSAEGRAHWCSNIYQTYARIVVKPERQTINVALNETGTLKVRVRNNFPYSLRYIQLRANNPSGLSVTVSPTEAEAQNQVFYPGQEVTFTLSITRTAGGSDDVADLNLEVNTRVENIGASWRDMDDWWVAQNPDASTVWNRINNNPEQSLSLLSDTYADLGCGSCEQDGVDMLMANWASRVSSCRSDFDSQWPMIFVRGGHQLAIRLRFGSFSSPSRSEVVDTMIAVMEDQYDIGRAFAAFAAAYGGNDAGVAARIQQMVDSDPDGSGGCSFSSSPIAQRLAKAALYIQGQSQHHADVTACYNDASGYTNNCSGDAGPSNCHEIRGRMLCAAALGIMGEDGPVTDYLIPNASTGSSSNYTKLFGAYLLQMVAYARRGGPDGVGVVSFFPEDVVQDDVPPRAPTNLTAQAPN